MHSAKHNGMGDKALPIIFDYKLNNLDLSTSDQHSYLGVILHSKTNRTVNFLKHNLSSCSSAIKATAYLTTIRPIMEYAAVIWDPFHLNTIQQLEKVQCRAARWVLYDFSQYSSVTAMIEHMSWSNLELQRKTSSLQTPYKIIN